MKSNIQFILFLFILFFYSCEKETEFDIPLVITGEVTKITNEGATFNAQITNLTDDVNNEYGFVYDNHMFPTLADGKISLFDKPSDETLNFQLKSGLRTGQTYFVRSYVKTNNKVVYGNIVSFESAGCEAPEIKNFTPKEGPIGSQIIIEGNNFGYLKKETTVMFGNVTAILDSVSNEKLFVTIPKITEGNKVNITIETGGINVQSEDVFDLWFPWKNIKANDNFHCNSHFQINNKGYMIFNDEMLIFDLESKRWETKQKVPSDLGIAIQSVTLNEKAYVLFMKGFWEFDPQTYKWTEKAIFSPFSISRDYSGYYTARYQYFLTNSNNRIFCGSLQDDRSFWEYDFDNDTWHEYTPSPNDIKINPLGSFSVNVSDKVYVGINTSGSQFWELNVTENVWQLLGDLPINSFSFWGQSVINNKFYFTMGYTDWLSNYSNQMWEFDPLKNEWTRFHNCPYSNAVRASFTYDNKAYFFCPWRIMEFNPARN